jgi:hypothetical protein
LARPVMGLCGGCAWTSMLIKFRVVERTRARRESGVSLGRSRRPSRLPKRSTRPRWKALELRVTNETLQGETGEVSGCTKRASVLIYAVDASAKCSDTVDHQVVRHRYAASRCNEVRDGRLYICMEGYMLSGLCGFRYGLKPELKIPDRLGELLEDLGCRACLLTSDCLRMMYSLRQRMSLVFQNVFPSSTARQAPPPYTG